MDTNNHIYSAQFSSCEKCNKIKVRYLQMWVGGSSACVKSATINKMAGA